MNGKNVPIAVLALIASSTTAFANPIAAARPGLEHVTFLVTDLDFPNPERGFYRPARSDLDLLTAGDARDAYDKGYRLLYAHIDLSAYRDTPLPTAYLRKLQSGFDVARSAGIKLIVRPVYNYPDGETDYQKAQDAPLAVVLHQIAQLAPLYARNEDVIAFFQAGFVGAWGEWHTSSNDLTAPTAQTQIKEALLAAVPRDRAIEFRYPRYLMEWQPTLPSFDPARPAAFRLGFHNDCFLASNTDVGTYPENPAEREDQKRYMADLTALAPFGAETCKPADEPGAAPRPDCDAILAEGARFHLVYLNDAYYRPLFHDNWTRQGCMDSVRRKLGYRFALTSLDHALVAEAGKPFPIRLNVRNEGWARLYDRHDLQLLLRDRRGRIVRLPIDGIDPRRWLPGQAAEAAGTVTLPKGLRGGRYDVLIGLADGAATLAGDPRYAIRFANADRPDRGQRWDKGAGAFVTGTSITIE